MTIIDATLFAIFAIGIALIVIGSFGLWHEVRRTEHEARSTQRKLKTAIATLRRIAARDMKAEGWSDTVEKMEDLAQRTLDAVDHDGCL